MSESITLSWEWVLGTLITLIIIFLAWIARQLSEMKKDFEARIRLLENENSAKTSKIQLLEKIILNPTEAKVE